MMPYTASGEPDWKQIAMQLLQAVSMMDTHTDGWEEGSETPDGALKAIDSETSRILWGKQEDSNPLSSYQNANYGEHTANGLMMDNKAISFNKDASYDKTDDDEPQNFDKIPSLMQTDEDDLEQEKKPKQPFINKPKGLRR